jgi:hypothetical protein
MQIDETFRAKVWTQEAPAQHFQSPAELLSASTLTTGSTSLRLVPCEGRTGLTAWETSLLSTKPEHSCCREGRWRRKERSTGGYDRVSVSFGL